MTNEPNIVVTGRKLTFCEGFRKANPQLFGLDRLPNSEREPDKRSRCENKQLETSATGLGYRITIISVRKRLVDEHDNLRTGAKPLVDAITETLGFKSDSDPRLQWEYGQVQSRSEPGTIVRIETI